MRWPLADLTLLLAGAGLYFLRRVLHDFPDTKCREILSHQIPAMKKGYSKVLICEAVLPATGCSGFEALADISRTTFSSMQRSEKQWRELLTSVGFKVNKIWPPPNAGPGGFAVIEAEIGGEHKVLDRGGGPRLPKGSW